jgi:hypothetical protein
VIFAILLLTKVTTYEVAEKELLTEKLRELREVIGMDFED